MGIPCGTGRFPVNIATFGKYNLGRIERLRSALTDSARRALDIIPVLLHENDPGLPGCLGEDTTPCGIASFSYSTTLRDLLAHQFSSFQIPRQSKPKFEILFVALIGSAGTSAFTARSDLDFWVGVDAGALGEGRYQLLCEKLKRIQDWASETADLETHFFPVDITDIRNDNYGSLNKESCGTALGKLLKDEFYRTGVFLHGKWPYFWVMPPGTSNADYAFHIARLSSDPSIPPESFVDLGNVHTLSSDEYYGAALWQMLKGSRFPFKSVLKMALLDSYSAQGRRVVPLCSRFKQHVLTSEKDTRTDPYLYMIDSLREYYTECSMVSVRELIEECFLVRGFMGIGGGKHQKAAAEEHFEDLAKKWGWESRRIAQARDYFRWDPFRRENFHKAILKFQLDCYKRIRERSSAESVAISPKDLTVLGRKLGSFLERKDGKVARELSLVSAKTIGAIEFRQQKGNDDSAAWNILIRGHEGPEYQVVTTVTNPFVACAWCCLNRYYNGNQRLGISGHTALSVKEADTLIRSLTSFFPPDEVDTIDVDALLSGARMTHLYIIPNWRKPQWRFGLESILVVLRSSFGELFYFGHEGSDCESWVTDSILRQKIGNPALRNLTWKVHLLRAQIGSTKRITDSLSRTVRDCIVAEKYRSYKTAG